MTVKTYEKLIIERKSTGSSMTIRLAAGLTLAQAKDYVQLNYPGWNLLYLDK